MFELRTLGAVDLVGEHGARPSPVLAQSKRLALLVYLAVARPRGFHRRDTLLPLFWPEHDEGHARSALRNALYFLRRTLGAAVVVGHGDADLGVDPSCLRSDVQGLEDAVQAGDLSSALALYGGEFLAGFHLSGCPEFEHWLEGERTRLRDIVATVAWRESERHVRAGDLRGAERVALRALGLSPADEGAARAFMESLAAAGGRAGAIRFFGRLAAAMDDEVGLGPSVTTKELVERIRDEDANAAGAAPGEGGGRVGFEADARPSVAVLPFEALTRHPDAELFGMGVMDDLLTRLGQVRGLRVVSRLSSMRFRPGEKSVPEVARELGVRMVLEGSVRREGGRVRLVAQLIDGASDDHVWAQAYDRDVHDIFEAQADIAERIATALCAELSDEEREHVRRIPTGNLGAWEAYVRAVQSYQDMGPRELNQAATHLRDAVRLDPGFARAWALLAEVLVLSGFCAVEPPAHLFPRIQEAANRALENDPRSGEAHAALGVLKLFHQWAPAEAEGAFARAVALAPDDTLSLGWQAIFRALQGEADRAVAAARSTVASDPLSAAAHLVLGQVLVMAGHPDEAVSVLGAGLEKWPRALQLHMWLGLAHVSCGAPGEALVEYEHAVELSGGLPHFRALRATALVALGRRDEACRIRHELDAESRRGWVDPYSLFSLDLVLEGPDAAVPQLERMLEARSVFLPYLRAIPRFRPLHGYPPFRKMLERVWGAGAATA
jgi:TolB-like protein/Tfp pilus assembly protein PilF